MNEPRFRVAIIGHTGRGDYGHGLDLVWQRFPEVHLVGIADADPPGLTQAATRMGLSPNQSFADYRQMLDAVRPDIVAICPRWVDQHYAMVLAAAERGIHIFLEKPFCRTLTEADAIVRQCQMTHARVALAHTTRYGPRWSTVQRLLAEGVIGEILEIRGRGKEDQRGGAEDLWVLGSHIVDMMRGLVGDPLWCSASVQAKHQLITPADQSDGPEGLGPLAGDHVQAMWGFANGVVGYFGSHRGAGGTPSRFGLQVFGSKGVLEMGTGHNAPVQLLADSSWSPGRSNITWQTVTSQGVGKPESLDLSDPLLGHELAVKDLLRSIDEHRSPLVDELAGRWTMEMILSCFASSVSGQRVPLPLAQRTHPLLTPQ